MRSKIKFKFPAAKSFDWVVPVLTAWLVMGCHKAVTTTSTPPPVSDTAVSTPADANSSPAIPANVPLVAGLAARADNAVHDSVNGEANAFLTQQLRIFVQQKGRLPASFNELASTRLDSIPRPPAGKKWAIDSSTSEVKATDAP